MYKIHVDSKFVINTLKLYRTVVKVDLIDQLQNGTCFTCKYAHVKMQKMPILVKQANISQNRG